VDWKAAYILDASDEDPEITQWDDKASMDRKMAEQARRKLGH